MWPVTIGSLTGLNTHNVGKYYVGVLAPSAGRKFFQGEC